MRQGQSDVGQLLAFIVGVTVLVAVVPVAFDVAGIDISDTSPEENTTAVDQGAVIVLSSYGSAIDDDRTTVGTVEMVVTPADENLTIGNMTVTWNGTDRYELTPPQVEGGNASFGVSPLDNQTDLQPGERAVVQFDRGTDDIEGTEQFGDRLTPGETVRLTLATGTGTETTLTLQVPETLPSGVSVRL